MPRLSFQNLKISTERFIQTMLMFTSAKGRLLLTNSLGVLLKEILALNTIQYNTIQYNTIQYNTIQYNTIQYSDPSASC